MWHYFFFRHSRFHEPFGKGSYSCVAFSLGRGRFFRSGHLFCVRQILQIGKWRTFDQKCGQFFGDFLPSLGPGLVCCGLPLGFWSLWAFNLWRRQRHLSIRFCNFNHFKSYHGRLDMLQNMCRSVLGLFVRWLKWCWSEFWRDCLLRKSAAKFKLQVKRN